MKAGYLAFRMEPTTVVHLENTMVGQMGLKSVVRRVGKSVGHLGVDWAA